MTDSCRFLFKKQNCRKQTNRSLETKNQRQTNVAPLFSLTKSVKFLRNLTESISMDTSSAANGKQKLFYNVAFQIVNKHFLHVQHTSFFGLKNLLDTIIELENLLFSKSRLLQFIVKFLVAHSDGDNLQCLINLKLLDYFLTTYNCAID
nr:hypothetical protein Caab_142 [Calliteara abietis nucleopolyhedrovirus]